MSNLETNMQFAIGLGDGVGQSLTYVWPCVICNDIIKNMGIKRLLTLDGFLFGLGVGFSKVIGFSTEQIRTSILQALSKYHHSDFGLGYGLGRTFPHLQQKLQEDSLALAEKERPIASGLGLGIGLSFMYLEPVVQQGLLRFTEENYELEIGFGQGIANVFPSLNPSLQEKILELVEKREGFATGVSQGLSKSLNYLDENLQKRLTGLTKIKEQGSTLGAPKSRSFAEYAYHEDDSIIVLNRNSDHTLHKEWQKADSSKEKPVKAEILFSGKREKYCVCYIDMMNSTKISATLDDLQLSKYYSIFLNSMATIAKNFGATIVKNAGDCLIYYFPATADPNQQNGFRNVIECGITMISAYQTINANIFEQRLPPLNYRISSDYGKIEVARSTSSQTEDLFGSAMNVCAKINSKAPANGMVIGHNMYKMCSTFAKEYDFERIGEYSGFKEIYPIYSVKSRQKRNILNPFKPQKENISDSSFHQHTP